MTSPWVMLLLLGFFSACLALVLSAYREEEPRAILRGAARRTLLFAGAVVGIAVAAALVTHFVLPPGA